MPAIPAAAWIITSIGFAMSLLLLIFKLGDGLKFGIMPIVFFGSLIGIAALYQIFRDIWKKDISEKTK